ncbi:hypothetical protein JHK82_035485 [Glycine max]|nr:hypothetical protein JHK82_035485 [Glycine max]
MKVFHLKIQGAFQVTFPKVKVRLKLGSVQRNIPHLTQVGPMLVTHWELSGPVVLRLSAWGARFLFSSGYKEGQFKDEFVTAGGVPLSERMLGREDLLQEPLSVD